MISCSLHFPIYSWQFNLNRSGVSEARNIPQADWSWQKLLWWTIGRCPQESGCHVAECLEIVRSQMPFMYLIFLWLWITKWRYLLLRCTAVNLKYKCERSWQHTFAAKPVQSFNRLIFCSGSHWKLEMISHFAIILFLHKMQMSLTSY